MKLSFSYAEFSFLRELVMRARDEIWVHKWVPMFTKKKNVDLEAEFRKIMNRESITWDTISSNEDCINMLLRRFDEVEQEFRKNVGRIE